MIRSALPDPVSVLVIGSSFSWASIRHCVATPILFTTTRREVEAFGRFSSHSGALRSPARGLAGRTSGADPQSDNRNLGSTFDPVAIDGAIRSLQVPHW